MPTFKRLLVPTDYSDCSRAAFAQALAIAAGFGASVELLHVWAAPYFGAGYGYEGAAVLGAAEMQSLFDRIREDAMVQMQAFAASVPVPQNVQLTTRVESGEAARVVVEIAEKDHPDLLVVGTHGRTGVRRWLIGSVAERIVQHAQCPVLTVPLPGGGAEPSPGAARA